MTQDTPNAEQPSADLVAEILRRDTEIRERVPVQVKPRSKLPWLFALLVVGVTVTTWNIIGCAVRSRCSPGRSGLRRPRPG